MSQTSPVTATEKHGVFKSSDGWRYRHYGPPHMEGQSAGPYPTRVEAMKALLHQVGFAVEDDQPAGLAQCPDQWQPIETAPRDGTELFFLRLPPYSATGNITIGFWHDGQNVPGFQSNLGGVIDTRIWNRWMLVPDAIALALSDTSTDREDK